jgi:hypothetical protein
MPWRSEKDTPGALIIPQNPDFIYNNFTGIWLGKTSQRKNKQRRLIMRKIFGFLIGILVGGLVGAVIALLLTPEPGEELRAQLRERGQSFLEEIRHAADERKIELRQRLDEMRAPREG